MKIPKSLSPAAQAVDRAIADRIQLLGEIAPSRQIAAAALVAAIDAGRRGPDHWQGRRPDDFDKGWEEALDWMAWVAAELEGAN